MKKLLAAILLVGLLGGAFVAYKIVKDNYYLWLSDYLFGQANYSPEGEIMDVVYLLVDHWEPGSHQDVVDRWVRDYRVLANRHVDSDGHKVQHTFYYPIEAFRGYQIDSLVRLCREGYGDVEVHWHHGGDDSRSFRIKLAAGLDSLRAHGAQVSADGLNHFSFIHGNWALDNSRSSESGAKFCGVNDEITALMEAGCYADLTFPALTQVAQPSLVNKIYYCVDDPAQPKSHDTGVQSRKGIAPTPQQFMILEGPLMINWHDWRFRTHPTIDDGNLYREIMPSIDRFDLWLSANIHVIDGPNWIFVRPFTHGCDLSGAGPEANLGPSMDSMLTSVEAKYRDNHRYRLHYVTAREAYNIVKAAEAGMTGDPNDYRDFVIKPYLYPDRGGARAEHKTSGNIKGWAPHSDIKPIAGEPPVISSGQTAPRN